MSLCSNQNGRHRDSREQQQQAQRVTRQQVATFTASTCNAVHCPSCRGCTQYDVRGHGSCIPNVGGTLWPCFGVMQPCSSVVVEHQRMPCRRCQCPVGRRWMVRGRQSQSESSPQKALCSPLDPSPNTPGDTRSACLEKRESGSNPQSTDRRTPGLCRVPCQVSTRRKAGRTCHLQIGTSVRTRRLSKSRHGSRRESGHLRSSLSYCRKLCS